MLSILVYFGNRLAPELWAEILAQPLAKSEQVFAVLGRLMSVIKDQADLRPMMFAECAISATAGYLVAARIFALRHISLT
jgi:hypothetical protein